MKSLSLISGIVHRGSIPQFDGTFLSRKIIGMVAPEGVIMLDFDLPEGGHEHSLVECVTIRTREEAAVRMQNFCQENPSTSFLVQNTAGGVRAFIAQFTCLAEGLRISAELNADPAYRMIAEGQGYMTIRVGNKWEENTDRTRTGNVRPEVWEKPWMIGTAVVDGYMSQWISHYWEICRRYDGIATWMTQEEHEQMLAESKEERRLAWLLEKKNKRNENGLTDKQQSVVHREMRRWVVANPRAGAEKLTREKARAIRKAGGK